MAQNTGERPGGDSQPESAWRNWLLIAEDFRKVENGPAATRAAQEAFRCANGNELAKASIYLLLANMRRDEEKLRVAAGYVTACLQSLALAEPSDGREHLEKAAQSTMFDITERRLPLDFDWPRPPETK